MPRSTKEWVGKTDNSIPPQRVRLRVFMKYDGQCYLSGKKIMPGDKWDLDHIKALSLGGHNAESNLAPVLKEEHKVKTASDKTEKANTDRLRAKHIGMKKQSSFAAARSGKFKKKLNGTVERR